MENEMIATVALSRRTFVKATCGVAALNVLSGASAQSGGVGSPHVNILYIHTHDSGRYLQPYGHNVPMPNLMRLAKDGIVFRQMHCASPCCSPSRAAMLTGQASHSSGMFGLAHRGWRLNDYQQHIIHTLKPHGYHTVLAGLQHVAAEPETIGYDEILPHKTTNASDVAPAAVEFIKNHKGSPFFLDVGFFETHRPFHPPVPGASAYLRAPFPIPDTPDTRLDMAGYQESARAVDDALGMVLDALDRAGLASNTLVISTTDHGVAFPYMKCDLRDTGTGVSMIVRGPGAFSNGKICDALLSHIDVYPTICDYLGIERPAWLQGKSFLPVLMGQKEAINDAVFSEVNFHASYEPKRSVRTARYKYIRRFDDRIHPVLPNCDEGLSKTYWVSMGWHDQPLIADSNHEELYDLIFDPSEHTNLADEPRMSAELDAMRKRLKGWMVATNDPLLKGPIPVPTGVRTDDPNALGPSLPPGVQAK